MTNDDKIRRIPKAAGWVNPKRLPKGQFGRALCRRCNDEVPYPRKTFCSDGCVHEWKIRSNPGYAAKEVLKRDAGVCALCARDCLALLRDLKQLRAEERKARWERSYIDRDASYPSLDIKLDRFQSRCAAEGLSPARRGLDRRLWEMDHIIPVSEGGGSCGLENLRTLCIPCHTRVTAELRARLRERVAKKVAAAKASRARS